MIKYKQYLLAKNSKAYEIYMSNEEDKLKKLDQHLKQVEANYKELTK